ncbi:SPHK2 kinase, partial [Rhinopomastus cyanomelas]|nr:SPHK2 kinase [Rhinopomastus cyanomelas]
PQPPSPMTDESLLEGDFGGPPGSGRGGPRFHLRLTHTELQISGGPPGGPFAGGGVLRLADVVGAQTLRAPALPSAAFFAVSAPPPRGGGSRRARRAPTFRVDGAPHYEGNQEVAERWARLIRCLLRGGEPPPPAGLPPEPPRRRLLLLLNPFGGRGQARSWCQSHVLPMISEAGISYNLVQTERANHARELVSGLSLDVFMGLGSPQVVNGLMDRPDWAAALRVPLGVLPCGSGNGVAAAINCRAGSPALGLALLQNCSVLLCRGSPAPLDLLSVTTASGGRQFGVLAVAWGLLADVDVGSERLRRLGPARFTLGAVARLLALQTYRGRLSYLPAPSPPRGVWRGQRGSAGLEGLGVSGRRRFRKGQRDLGVSAGFDDSPDLEDPLKFGDPLTSGDGAGIGDPPGLGDPSGLKAAAGHGLLHGDPLMPGSPPEPKGPPQPGGPVDDLLVPLGQPLPPGWVTLEGDFVLVLATSQSHLGAQLVAAPLARPDDGLVHLCFVRGGASRGALLRALLAMASGATPGPPVASARARAFRL